MTNNNKFEKREDSESMYENELMPCPNNGQLCLCIGICKKTRKQYNREKDLDKILKDLGVEKNTHPQPSEDVDYSDYIKRTPIHITMAEMMIDSLKGGLGNQVYIDALEDHIKALTTPRIEDTNVSEALEALDMVKYHHNQVSEPAFNGYISIIRQALQQIEGGNQ